MRGKEKLLQQLLVPCLLIYYNCLLKRKKTNAQTSNLLKSFVKVICFQNIRRFLYTDFIEHYFALPVFEKAIKHKGKYYLLDAAQFFVILSRWKEKIWQKWNKTENGGPSVSRARNIWFHLFSSWSTTKNKQIILNCFKHESMEELYYKIRGNCQSHDKEIVTSHRSHV